MFSCVCLYSWTPSVFLLLNELIQTFMLPLRLTELSFLKVLDLFGNALAKELKELPLTNGPLL